VPVRTLFHFLPFSLSTSLDLPAPFLNLFSLPHLLTIQVVVLLREVRQLQSMGLPIKRDILIEVETAAKFYR
jgi:hypothetical protein